MERYNYLGMSLGSNSKTIKENSYLDEFGNVKWDEYVKTNDPRGFADGDIQNVVLRKGKVIVRYGSPNGTFTTDKGTEYSTLSLPYVKESIEYHEYVVVEDCVVEKGVVAEGFDSKGGGIQYHHLESIRSLLKKGVLKEELLWLKNL